MAAFFSSIERQYMIGTGAIAGMLLAVAVLAFGGGFAVADWRKSGELEKSRSESKLLTASNNRCAADVQNVNAVVEAMILEAGDRERKAQEAMKQTEPIVEKRKATITRIRALPAVKPDMQCEAMSQEQIAYVQARHESQ
jgi:hypothetical protein